MKLRSLFAIALVLALFATYTAIYNDAKLTESDIAWQGFKDSHRCMQVGHVLEHALFVGYVPIRVPEQIIYQCDDGNMYWANN